MSIGKICTREVYLASPQESVSDAAQRMAVQNIGCLVVVSDTKRPIGMITDRDITVKLTAKGLDSNLTTVAEVMTQNPKVVQEIIPIEEAVALMRTVGVRRLPVVDGSGLVVGLVCLDDLLDLLLEEFSNVRELLHRQTAFKRRAG